MGRGAGGGVLWLAVSMVLVLVSGVCPSKIYNPSNLHEIPLDIAIRKCQKNPNCYLPPYLATESRCKGTEVLKAINEIRSGDVTTRSGGGGGGGAGLCNGLAGEVVWPATGECVTLLTQGPCPPGQWVQLLKTTFEPVCRPQPCDVPLTRGGGPGVVVDGDCHSPSQLPPAPQCPNNQVWVANEHGEAECDCPPGLVYYAEDDSCYRPYSPGPCAPGWVIKVEDSVTGKTGEAKCFPNECPEANMVSLDDTCRQQAHIDANPNCYSIDTAGPCEEGNLIRVDDVLAEPICLTTHCLFCNTVAGCPRGSIRDRQGRCRSEFNAILSSVPLITASRAAPGRGRSTVCPPGEFFAAGTCIRVAG